MADNIPVNPGVAGNAVSVATDEIDGTHYPVYKLAIGEDGEASLVSIDNAVPIKADSVANGKLLSKLDEILTQLKIMNTYNSLGHDEIVTGDHIDED